MDPLSHLPSFSATVENGASVLRDGWVGVFYLLSPCSEHQAAASHCIADYLRRASSSELRWTIDSDGDAVELSEEQINQRLTDLLTPGNSSVGFRLMDNPRGVSGFRTRYIGLHPSDPMIADMPDAVSLLLFTYPTEAAAASGLEAIVQFHDSVVNRLPVSSAYTAPAFLFAPGAGEPGAFQTIRRLCRRYRCLDIPYISLDCFEVGAKVKGAYWLNHLGAATVSALGGAEAISAVLQGTGVLQRSLSRGTLALQVAAPPTGGDTNRHEDVSAYTAIARSIRPLQYVPSISFPEFELEETGEWFNRFAEPPH